MLLLKRQRSAMRSTRAPSKPIRANSSVAVFSIFSRTRAGSLLRRANRVFLLPERKRPRRVSTFAEYAPAPDSTGLNQAPVFLFEHDLIGKRIMLQSATLRRPLGPPRRLQPIARSVRATAAIPSAGRSGARARPRRHWP